MELLGEDTLYDGEEFPRWNGNTPNSNSRRGRTGIHDNNLHNTWQLFGPSSRSISKKNAQEQPQREQMFHTFDTWATENHSPRPDAVLQHAHLDHRKRGPWSPDEDAELRRLVTEAAAHKDNSNIAWPQIARRLNNGRSGKQCRERWEFSLNPAINHSPWTPEEDALLIEKQEELGNQWARISKYFHGRTDNAVKIRFKSLRRARKRMWSDEEDGKLLTLCGGETFCSRIDWDEIAQSFPGRSRHSVRRRYKELLEKLQNHNNNNNNNYNINNDNNNNSSSSSSISDGHTFSRSSSSDALRLAMPVYTLPTSASRLVAPLHSSPPSSFKPCLPSDTAQMHSTESTEDSTSFRNENASPTFTADAVHKRSGLLCGHQQDQLPTAKRCRTCHGFIPSSSLPSELVAFPELLQQELVSSSGVLNPHTQEFMGSVVSTTSAAMHNGQNSNQESAIASHASDPDECSFLPVLVEQECSYNAALASCSDNAQFSNSISGTTTVQPCPALIPGCGVRIPPESQTQTTEENEATAGAAAMTEEKVEEQQEEAKEELQTCFRDLALLLSDDHDPL